MPAEVLALLDGDIAVHMADGLADVYAEAFAAFGYGHTSRPGQRWHDRAADALAADEAARWLDEPFVVVDLAVRPRCRRQGIGGRLHDLLLEHSRMPPRCSRPAGTTPVRSGCTMVVAGRRSGATSPSSPAAIRT